MSLMLWSTWVLAQSQNNPPSGGGGGSVTTSGGTVTTTTSEVWYTHWWIWAVGVAVFLIIVIALTNRPGGRSSTT